MIKTLERNAANDIFLHAGKLAVVSDIEAQISIIESIVLTQKGELQFDDEAGVDYFGTVFQSSRYIELWAADIRSQVLSLDFVSTIERFEYRFDGPTSTLYWAMSVRNTNDKILTMDNRKILANGAPGVDIKWDDVHLKPLNVEESLDMVSDMSETAKKIDDITDDQSLKRTTFGRTKEIINEILFESWSEKTRAKKKILLTFDHIPIGQVVDFENLVVNSNTTWVVDFGNGNRLSFGKNDHKIVTEWEYEGGEKIPVSYKYTFVSRGKAQFSIYGGITSISCDDSNGPILKSLKGGPFLNFTAFSVGEYVPLAEIGDNSFNGFSNLKYVEWNNLEEVVFGDKAFKGCSSLHDIRWLPKNLVSMGESCFEGCSDLVGVTGIPNGITSLPDRCFKGCSSLSDVNGLPTALTEIGEECFKDCQGLKTIDGIPDAVDTLPREVFSGCSGITAILYPPEGLKTIGESSFEGCTSLKSLYLPTKTVSILDNAFANCESLDNIFSDADTVPTCADTAFFGTSENLILYVKRAHLDTYSGGDPEDASTNWGKVPIVKNYGLYLFEFDGFDSGTPDIDIQSEASKLLSDSIWTMDSGLGSSWKYRFENSVTTLPDATIPLDGATLTVEMRGYIRELEAGSANSYPFMALGTMGETIYIRSVETFDAPLEYIGESCFRECLNLRSVTINEQTQGSGEYVSPPFRLGDRAFYGCTNFENLSWLPPLVGKVVDTESSTTEQTVYYPAFGEACFQNSGIVALNYPKEDSYVTGFPAYCFAGTKLTTLSGIGGDIFNDLGEHCFDGCTELTQIEDLSDSGVQFLPDYCFANCSALESIAGIENIISTKREWADTAGTGSYSEVRTTILGTHIFANCSNLEDIIPLADAEFVPPPDWDERTPPYSAGIYDLSAYMFAGCTGIKTLDGIPPRLVSVGEHCFDGCTSISYQWDDDGNVIPVTEHDGDWYSSPLMPFSWTEVKALPDGCFAGCTGLQNLIGLDKIASIGSSCFSGCTGLISTTGLGTALSSIGSSAFSDCTGLQYVTVMSSTPPTASLTCFSGVQTSSIPLFVREEAISSYKSAQIWSSFNPIESRTIKIKLANGVSIITDEQAQTMSVVGFMETEDGKYIPGLFYVDYGDELIHTYIGDMSTSLSEGHDYGDSGEHTIKIFGDVLRFGALEQGNPSGADGHYIPSDGFFSYNDQTGHYDYDSGTSTATPVLGDLSAYIYSVGINALYLQKLMPYSFCGCGSLTSLEVKMADSGEIGAFAFAGCSKLRTISTAKFATAGDCAFLGCSILEEIDSFLENVGTASSIGDYCFAGDILLSDISGLAYATQVGNYSFHSCIVLGTTSGLGSVQKIGAHAFDGCRTLSTITGLGGSIVEIGDYAFTGCPIVDIFLVTEVPPFIYEHTFDDSTYESEDVTLYVPFRAIDTYRTEMPTISDTIWDGNTFNYWSRFINITCRNIVFQFDDIPYGMTLDSGYGYVEATGEWMISFGDGEDIMSFVGSAEIPQYRFKTEGSKEILITGEITGLSLVCPEDRYPFFHASGTQSGEFTYLKSVVGSSTIDMQTFGKNVFRNCIWLESIKDCGTVVSVGDSCFNGCIALKDITGLTGVETIGAYAFSKCTKLKDLKGLDSTVTVGEAAFAGCTSLQAIDGLGMNIEKMAANAFQNCTAIKEVQIFSITPPDIVSADGTVNNALEPFPNLDKTSTPLYVLTRSLDAYKAHDYWSKWGDNISARAIYLTMQDVPQYTVFDGHKGKVSSGSYWVVDFGYDGIAEVGNTGTPQVFGEQSGENVQFKTHTFASTGAGELVVKIEGDVTGIYGSVEGDETYPLFSTLTSGEIEHYLIKIEMSDSSPLHEIGDYAFAVDDDASEEDASKLKEVQLDNLNTVGSHAFENCKGLVDLSGFGGLVTIGDGAFKGCTGFKNLSGLSRNLVSIGEEAFGGGIEIEYIQISAITPPALNENAFNGSYGMVNGEAVLIEKAESASHKTYYKGSVMVYVPMRSVNAYENATGDAEPWSWFGSPTTTDIDHYISSLSLVLTLSDVGEGTWFSSSQDCITADGAWSVDWGDGTVDTLSETTSTIPSHQYAEAGTYTVTIEGSITEIGGTVLDSSNGPVSYTPILVSDPTTTNNYLTSVVCSDAMQIKTIRPCCFAGCSNLTTVSGFKNVTSVGFGAFFKCSSLSYIGEFTSLSNIQSYAFAECYYLSTLISFPNVITLGNYAFRNNTSLKTTAGLGTVIGRTTTNAKFGTFCFLGCPLAEIFTEYKYPPLIEYTTFGDGTEDFYNNTPVYVPVGSLEDYEDQNYFGNNITNYWARFAHIYEQCFLEFTFDGIQSGDTITPFMENDDTWCNIVATSQWTVDWGDSTLVQYSPTVTAFPSHTYSFEGAERRITVRIRGNIISFNGWNKDNDDSHHPIAGVLRGSTYLTDKLQSVRFSHLENFTTIGKNSFYGCTGLTSVLIQNGTINEIGDYAFSGCTALTSACLDGSKYATSEDGTFYLPKELSSIGNNAFAGCTAFSTLDWDAYVRPSLTSPETATVGTGAFRECSSLTTVLEFGGIKEIPDHCFFRCGSISAISNQSSGIIKVLGNEGVTSLGDFCFARTTTLDTVSLPDSVISIGVGCFSCAPWLSTNETFDQPSGGQSYTPGYQFVYSSLTDYDNANYQEYVARFVGTQSVGLRSFSWASRNLVNYTIGWGCFVGCSRLQTIQSFPNKIHGLDGEDGTTRIDGIPSSTFLGCKAMSDFSSIPQSSIKAIGQFAFAYTGIMDIGSAVFPVENTQQGAINYIDAGLFMGCSGLSSIDGIPSYITQYGTAWNQGIDAHCFANCTGLQYVSFPTRSDSKKIVIGDFCFRGCTRIQNVEANSVSSFGKYCFSNCSTMSVMTAPALTTAAENCFSGCTALSNISASALASLGIYCFDGCTGLQVFNGFPNVTNYPTGCFNGCTSLTKVVFTGTNTTIGNYVFNDCSNITEIVFRNSDNVATVTGEPFPSIEKSNVVLKFKMALYTLYSKDNYWKDFILIAPGQISLLLTMTVPEEGGTIYGNGTLTLGASESRCSVYFDDFTDPVVLYPDQATHNVNFAAVSHVYQADSQNPSGKTVATFGVVTGITGTKTGTHYVNDNGRPIIMADTTSGTNDWLTQVGIKVGDDGFTTFGDGCLSNCKNLTSVSVSHIDKEDDPQYAESPVTTITKIGDFAFSGDKALTAMPIPSGNTVVSVGLSCFRFCDAITDISPISMFKVAAIPDGFLWSQNNNRNPLTSDFEMSKLNSVTTKLGQRAFYGVPFNKLCDVSTGTVGSGRIMQVMFGCFSDNRQLTTVDLIQYQINFDRSGTAIFANDSILSSVSSTSFTGRKVPNGTFKDCTAISSMSCLPSSIVEIGQGAFMNTAITDLRTLPPNISVIGDPYNLSYGGAFEGCKFRKYLDVSWYSPFTPLRNIGSVTTIGCRTFANTGYGDAITIDLSTLGSLTIIGDEAFADNENYNDIRLPLSVSYLGKGCFSKTGISSTATILQEGNTTLDSLPESCFENCALLSETEIPSAVKVISPYCFYGCKVLSGVTLNRYDPQDVNNPITTINDTPSVNEAFNYQYYNEGQGIVIIVPPNSRDDYVDAWGASAGRFRDNFIMYSP